MKIYLRQNLLRFLFIKEELQMDMHVLAFLKAWCAIWSTE